MKCQNPECPMAGYCSGYCANYFCSEDPIPMTPIEWIMFERLVTVDEARMILALKEEPQCHFEVDQEGHITQYIHPTPSNHGQQSAKNPPPKPEAKDYQVPPPY